MSKSVSESSTAILLENVCKTKEAEGYLGNHALLKFLVESSDDAIICKSLEGTIVSWNAGAQRIYGYAAEEVIGKPIAVLVPPEIPDEIQEILEKIKRGEHVDHYQTVRVRKDHCRIDVSICVSPIKDEHDNIIGASAIARDITEDMKTKRNLEESEEKYRKLVENAPIGISLLQGDRIVMCNSKMLEILGLEKPDLVGHSVSKLVPREHLPEFTELSQKAMQSKTASSTFRFEKTRVDGAKLYLESQVFPSSYGGQECTVVFQRDITEHKKKEKELQESEAKYKALFDGSNDGIIEIEPSTYRIVLANPAICKLTGYTEKELLKLKVEDIHSKKDLPFVTEQIEKTARGEMPLPEAIPVLKKDKSLIYCHINASTLEVEKQRLVVAFFRDVTESKKAQDALLRSEEKYRSLVENIQDVVFAVDVNGKVTFVSPSAERITGFKLNDTVGKPFLDFFPLTGEGHAQSIFAKMLKGECVRGEQATIPRKDGTPTYYEANMYPIFLNGEIVGIQGVARDITERKKAEEKIRETNQKLEVTNEKLRVTGGLTRHDVRNKLTAITGNAYLVKKKLPENSVILDYVEQIEESVKQSVRILDFAKTYEMLGAEELAYIDVEKTVNEAVSLLPDLRDIKVKNDCHGLTVLADSLLTQLFYNLIDNSLKYGEKLSMIRIHYEDKNDHLNMIYKDDGAGISKAAKTKIFSEGYTTGKGSGYGLYLIKKMMEVYGWTIKETGELGKGALFTMTIPKTNEKGKINCKLH